MKEAKTMKSFWARHQECAVGYSQLTSEYYGLHREISSDAEHLLLIQKSRLELAHDAFYAALDLQDYQLAEHWAYIFSSIEQDLQKV